MVRMSRRILLILTLVILALVPESAEAQRRRIPYFLRGFYLNAKVGPNLFFGSLVDDGKWRLGLDTYAQKELMPFLTARAGLGGGMLHGHQESGTLEFKTTYINFNVGLDCNILNLIQGYDLQRMIEPYFGLGGGVLMYSATKELDYEIGDALAEIDDWRNVETGFTAAPFVYGLIGGRYQVNKHWGISLEVQGNYVFANDLDGHSGYRRNPTAAEQAAINAGTRGLTEAEQAWIDETGRSDYIWVEGKNDCFWTIMAGVSYKFYDSLFRHKSRFNREVYLQNRKAYKRNASRVRRR